MSTQQKLPQLIHGQPSMGLPFEKELVVDLFAGGGGASTGIARAYREPDVAVNHNPIALAVHRANHPNTAHYVADVYEVDPRKATDGQPVAIIWASPDCRHHSKAKGGAPRDRGVRGLAWVMIRWLFVTRSRLLFLENVEEFCDWDPIDDHGQPIKAEHGRTFKAFIAAISTGLPAEHPDMPEIMQAIGEFVPMEALVKGLGYNTEWRERIAANAGAPTIRKRLYLVARSDGLPIVWPEPVRHKKPAAKQQTWRTAAECIDWSNLGKTIFRDKPMAFNTRRRVAGAARHGIVAANMVTLRKGSVGADVEGPLGVVATSIGHHAVTAAFFEQANGGFYKGDGRSAYQPTSTICQSGANQRLATAHLVKYYGCDKGGVSLTEPMHTLPTKDRVALVEVLQVPDTLTPEQMEGARRCAAFMHEHLPEHFKEPAEMIMIGGYVLVDITLRMLQPPELKAAQGFDKDYIIDRGFFVDPVTSAEQWLPINKTNQVRLIGNSVCPDEAEALVRANTADITELYQRLAA